MYNSPVPPKSELPTSAQLLKSTLIAAGVAATLLVTVVLPSEYNIDPTGVGKDLGLKQMGEIKSQLAEEAETDRRRDLRTPVQLKSPSNGQQSSTFGQFFAALFVTPAYAHDGQDQYDPQTKETSVQLAPGEGLEVKLEMHKGGVVEFDWTEPMALWSTSITMVKLKASRWCMKRAARWRRKRVSSRRCSMVNMAGGGATGPVKT
jgi:hypothetical protein